jgi:hypothetical protein
MAHYAFLNQFNIVTEVIVGKDESEFDIDWEEHYGNIRNQVCKRTSYNTHNGTHILGGTPFRKNYAGIGYLYDEQRDAFIPPKPFDSWILDEETCNWNSPIPKPEFTEDEFYVWNESLYASDNTRGWELVQFTN